MEEQLETISQVKSTLVDLAVRFGPRVLAAILILTIGVFVSRWLSGWVQRALLHFELEPPVRLLLSRMVRVLVFALFLIMAMQNLGVELLPLIAGLGIAGAGIALAMQGVLATSRPASPSSSPSPIASANTSRSPVKRAASRRLTCSAPR